MLYGKDIPEEIERFNQKNKKEFDDIMDFCIHYYDENLTTYQNFKDIIPIIYIQGYKKALLLGQK